MTLPRDILLDRAAKIQRLYDIEREMERLDKVIRQVEPKVARRCDDDVDTQQIRQALAYLKELLDKRGRERMNLIRTIVSLPDWH